MFFEAVSGDKSEHEVEVKRMVNEFSFCNSTEVKRGSYLLRAAAAFKI